MTRSLQLEMQHHLGCLQAELIPVSSGWSGQRIYRLLADQREFAIRSWPLSGESINKIDLWIQAASAFLDAEPSTEFDRWTPLPTPLSWTEAGSSFILVAEGLYWTRSLWLPGSPLQRGQLALPVKLDYARRLAYMHRVQREIGAIKTSSPGLLDRLKALESWSDWARPPSIEFLKERLNSCERDISQRLDQWKLALRKWLKNEQSTHWIIRDLWRNNILVDDSQRWLSTVDVGASRSDWPALDFVRLFGSLQCSQSEWEKVRATYLSLDSNASLPSCDECIMIHQISTAISIRYWLGQLRDTAMDHRRSEIATVRVIELLEDFQPATWH